MVGLIRTVYVSSVPCELIPLAVFSGNPVFLLPPYLTYTTHYLARVLRFFANFWYTAHLKVMIGTQVSNYISSVLC